MATLRLPPRLLGNLSDSSRWESPGGESFLRGFRVLSERPRHRRSPPDPRGPGVKRSRKRARPGFRRRTEPGRRFCDAFATLLIAATELVMPGSVPPGTFGSLSRSFREEGVRATGWRKDFERGRDLRVRANLEDGPGGLAPLQFRQRRVIPAGKFRHAWSEAGARDSQNPHAGGPFRL